MKKIAVTYVYDVVLFCFFLFCARCILHYYPIPQLSWDSYYYIRTGAEHKLGIRPNGYGAFLNYLYSINTNILFIVYVQFALFYLAILFLLQIVKRIFDIRRLKYFLLGLVLLAEPIALYHCDSILSDLLFMALTIFSLGCLLLYITGRHYAFFIMHVLFIFLCIEVRHIALFYPFFSCTVLLLFGKTKWLTVVNAVIILVIYYSLYNWHVNEHKKQYGVAVYSPFSGWTYANNALYAMTLIPTDAIKDEKVRRQHKFFKQVIEANNFHTGAVGSDYLWDDKSPLNVVRLKMIDITKADYTQSWFLCAPDFERYGTYIETHFPLAYIKSYMVPNVKTLITPIVGEMADYNITPFIEPFSMGRYQLKDEDIKCKNQVYSLHVNDKIIKLYKLELLLFIISIIGMLRYRKDFTKDASKGLFTIVGFVILFYGLMLYSSWFMLRYLIPVIPLMVTTIVITGINFFKYYNIKIIKKEVN